MNYINNNVLNLFSLVLALIILFIILFGCKCHRRYERFENAEKKEEQVDEKKTENKSGAMELLSSFEKSILDGLSAGSITSKDLTSLIKNEQFTEKNLDNLITYVEKFKGGLISN
jgi:flagellar biosynthesis/type III secretory pathway M-ring protein FliF/YscJ